MVYRTLRAIGAAGLVLLWSMFQPANAKPKTIEDYEVGDWRLAALTDDSGSPDLCLIQGGSRRTESTVFGVMVDRSSHAWFLLLQNSDWKLSQGEERYFAYAIDQNPKIAVKARALNPNILAMELGPSFSATAPIRQGRRIGFRDTESVTTEFSLEGSGPALDALLDCAQQHLGFADTAHEAAGPAPAQSSVLENRNIGAWSLIAVADKAGVGKVCTVAHRNDQGVNLNIVILRASRVLAFDLDGTDAGWRLKPGEYDVSFAVDDHPSIAAKAISNPPSDIQIPFAESFSEMEFLRRGDVIEFRAARGEFRFDLKGSSAALDALADCAAKHLGHEEAAASTDPFSPDPATPASPSPPAGKSATAETSSASAGPENAQPMDPGMAQAQLSKVEERTVGRWKLTAVVQTDTDYALCLVTTLNDLGEHLNIVVERPKHLWSLAFAGRDVRLRQGVGSDFEVTYAIDDNEPERVQAIPSESGRVFVQLGQDIALTEPVRRGSRIAFETADGPHVFSLAGSSAALDALSDCAMRHLGFVDANTSSVASTPASAAPTPEIDTTKAGEGADGSSGIEATVDQAVATAKQLRMARTIFTHDSSAESTLWFRLHSALATTPQEKWAAVLQTETQTFLAERLAAAVKVAPSDSLTKLVRHDRDVMRQLQSQPKACAAFFKANGNGDFSALPPALRAAQAEIYADVIEAAMERPTTLMRYEPADLVEQIMAAYERFGYPLADLKALGKTHGMDDETVCRIGNEFSAALATLDADKSGEFYRMVQRTDL